MHGTIQSHTPNCKVPCIRHKQSILIVEDENLVAWDIEQTLRDHDFQNIMIASSVRGVRELMQSVPCHISLVILDLKLDDGDSRFLIDEFIAQGTAVIVMTGYSEFAHASIPVVYKPFATSKMMQIVGSLLDFRS